MKPAGALVAVWASLYDFSVARLLEERFPEPNVSYVLLDARTGGLIASRWDRLNQPIPVGSLAKPFTALAYGEAHSFTYPELFCTGKRCWRPRGHGKVGLVEAIGYSCNEYFGALSSAAARNATPLSLARAYCHLAARREEAGVREILRGMAMSATLGTAKAIGSGLAKTGTAPCTHRPRAPGDGYVVALDPAERPITVLLVRVHGVPGAEAAKVAEKILRTVREGK